MKYDDEEFFKKLCAAFRIEAKERIHRTSNILLTLEQTKDKNVQLELINTIARELHSLKSAARAVKIIPVEAICQKMESLFAICKEQNIMPSIIQFDQLHQVINFIDDFLVSGTLSVNEKKYHELLNNLDIMYDSNENKKKEEGNAGKEKKSKIRKEKIKHKKSKIESSLVEFEPEALQKTIRISASKLDNLLNEAEEMIATKINLSQRLSEINVLKNNIMLARKDLEKTIPNKIFLRKQTEPSSSGDSSLIVQKKILDYLNFNEKNYKLIYEGMDVLANKLEQNIHSFSIGMGNLLEDSKKLLLWPFSTILDVLPGTVRELSRSLGKQVNIKIEGSELEIDKRILEEMKDVLLHMVRNSIDHGIEIPEQRKMLGKSETGIIHIHIQHLAATEIQLTFSDDGKGLPLSDIIQSAVEQGFIDKKNENRISNSDASQLIFQSGLSTSKTPTELSGRGLGMSIVQGNIEKIGGKISLETVKDKGTTFKITLPLTLATFRGMLIGVADRQFIIPTSNVERIIRISKDKIKNIENRPTIPYASEIIPIMYLSEILGLPKGIDKESHSENIIAIVLSSSETKIAFVVDEIISEQEILVKNFNKPLIHVQNIAAAAILGSGKPVPILNAKDLLHLKTFDSLSKDAESTMQMSEILSKKILLAEDSITTRMLIKNILELEGFDVVAVTDGLEAWQQLKENTFDVLISDIEMPNMDGFELTEKVRHDAKLKDLPIILVTALTSEKDRERGIDLGANAYVVKNTFDSKHLINIIKRIGI